MNVSVFKNFKEVTEQLPMAVILDRIRDGSYRAQVEGLRKIIASGDQKEYDRQKKFLPAFTPSATFEGGRKFQFLKNYSAFIILDIDKLSSDQLVQAFSAVVAIPYTFACFRSPSNNGLKILVRTSSSLSEHNFAYNEIKNHYEQMLILPIDPSGKDVTRLCFFSWDPDLFFNPNAETFIPAHLCTEPLSSSVILRAGGGPSIDEDKNQQTKSEVMLSEVPARPKDGETDASQEKVVMLSGVPARPKDGEADVKNKKSVMLSGVEAGPKRSTSISDDIENVTTQIEAAQIDITNGYKDWLTIGFALADALGESGRTFFNRVSSFNSQYDAAACDKQFDACLKSTNSGVTSKSFFFLAKEHGIDISKTKCDISHSLRMQGTASDEPEKNESTEISHSPQERGTASEEKKEEPEKPKNNLFDIIERFLLRSYTLRYNIVTAKLEIRRNGELCYEPMTDYMENSIYRQLHKSNIQVSMAKLRSILQSDFCTRYDPFQEYFDNLLPWDRETDHIIQLASTVKTNNDDLWYSCFKKWIVAVVASLLDTKIVNHTAIIFSGGQGIGKTTWMEKLCPPELRNYLFSGTINPNNKDTLIHISECMLINMDELENMNRTEIGTLKEIITKSAIRIRRSYGHNAESLTRRASFMGSVNTSQFLNDSTGSRRFLCFEAMEIEYKHSVDIRLVLAQALALWKDGFRFYFDKAEVGFISDNNDKYQIRTAEEELLLTWFQPVPLSECSCFLTSSQIGVKLSEKTHITVSSGSVISLGKALKKHDFIRTKRGGVYVWAVKELTYDEVDIATRGKPDEVPF